MAALTWRNVAAPDFRGAMEGYRQFSSLLSNAFTGLQGGLEELDNSKSDRVNSALMAEIAGAQDTEAAKAIAAAAGSKYDPSRIKGETWQALMGRPLDLVKQEAAESELDFTNWTRDLTKKDRAALDAAAPALAALGAARASGDPAKITAVTQQYGEQLSKLPFDKILSTYSGLQDLEKGAVDITGARQDQTIQKTEFDWRGDDRAATLEAEKIAAQALADGGGTAEGARAAFTKLSSGASPRARFLAMGLINQNMGSGIFAPDEINAAVGGGSTGGAGGDPTRVMNYEARAAGFASVPASVKTLGQAYDFALQINRAGVDSSAMGVYQIVGDTLRRYAPKVLGSNWRNQAFNLEAQDKIAEAIFNDHRGSAAALRKQWVSLSPAEAERARRLPWAQAREIIAQGESGASPAALFGATRAASAQIAGRTMQNDRHGVTGDFAGALQDRSDPAQVVDQLLEGAYKGTDRGFLIRQVNRIMRDGKVNAAMAGAILRRNIAEDDPSVLGRAGRAINQLFGGDATPDLGGGVRINDRGLDEDIKLARSGKLYDQVANQQRTGDTQAQLATAQQNYQQKLALFNQAKRRAETGGMSADNLARYARDLAEAQQAYQALLMSIRNDPTLMAERETRPNGGGW